LSVGFEPRVIFKVDNVDWSVDSCLSVGLPVGRIVFASVVVYTSNNVE